ncbi:MAG: DUF2304 domain-containing protein [Beduini sp.]|uniref:DUF2304 domain-containing protein n=1 Tax=Beduini sp. TaxID=1922300 RepID=UPI003990B16C
MSLKIQIIVFCVLLLAFIFMITLIRKNKLNLKYAISWLVMGIGILILDLFPQIMVWLAKELGIFSVTNMLFFLGFCFSLLVVFSLTLAVSSLASKLEKLAQELALYKKNQEEKEVRLEEQKNKIPFN